MNKLSKDENRVAKRNKHFIDPKFTFIKNNKIITDKKIMYQTLDMEGNLKNEKYKTKLSDKQLQKAYECMVLSRKQDEYMTQLQRQGKMLTFAPNFGEEALQVAAGLALEKKDFFVPAFRSNATMLFLGVPLINQMRYWNGQEDGSKIPEGVNVLPINVPIATQYSHAAGIAYAFKLRKEKQVSLTFIGDGGSSEGEFYEAMNMAGVHKWPVVFCVNNNQFAISTRTKQETNAATISQKSVAAGIPGIRVDGNDLLASYDVVKQAVDYAREGNGPILVEFFTWRQGVHTSSDDPSVYRTKAEEKKQERWEPFHRIEKYLIDKYIYTEKDIEQIKKDKLELVKETYKKSMISINTKLDDIFDYTYATLPDELLEQKEEAKKEWGEK